MIRFITRPFVNWAIERAFDRYERSPDKQDFTIGRKDRPQVLRWYGIPRNPFFNVYYHVFLRSDADFALHDHPWLWNFSIIVQGPGYYELVPDPFWVKRMGVERAASDRQPVALWRPVGTRLFRWGWAPHRIMLKTGQPVHTVFITGPKLPEWLFGEWGFYCAKGKIPFSKMVKYKKGEGSEPLDGCP